MRIKLQKKKDSAIVIDIGYETDFQASLYFISIIREYYDEDGDFYDAKWIKGLFKR